MFRKIVFDELLDVQKTATHELLNVQQFASRELNVQKIEIL